MTRNHHHLKTDLSSRRPSRTPRRGLNAKAPRTGYSDGARWPHINRSRSQPVDHIQSRRPDADQDHWESDSGSPSAPTITGLSTNSNS